MARRHQLQFPEHGGIALRHLSVPTPADVAAARPQGKPGQPEFFPAFDGDRIIGAWQAEGGWVRYTFVCGADAPRGHGRCDGMAPRHSRRSAGRTSCCVCSYVWCPTVALLPCLGPADVLPHGAGVVRAECEPTKGQKRGHEAAPPPAAAKPQAQPPAGKQQQQQQQQGKPAAAAAAAPATEGPQKKRRRRGSGEGSLRAVHVAEGL